ncbi:MAG: glycosyltransferase family 4 protein [Bacteroidales bacterium]|nr:glycosyltransferase family 4 protein [Bacteroidales bacterium]
MKILIISDKPPWPGTSGGALAVMEIIKALARQKAGLSIIYAVTAKHDDTAVCPHKINGVNINNIPVRINTGINIASLILNILFSKLPYNITRFNSAVFRKKLKELLKEVRYDIVQLEGLNMSGYIKTIRQHSDAHIAIRSHNVEHEIWSRLAANEKNYFRSYYMGILSRRLKKHELQAIRLCDFHIPLTGKDNTHFLSAGINIPYYIYPYAHTVKERADTKINKNTICYIGSLDWRPNQEGIQWFLNKVWDLVLAACPDLTLLISGRNAPEWLVKKFKRKGVRYYGEVNNAEDFMDKGEIMIIPLLSGSGIRVRAIQAMARGIPIVTTLRGIDGIDARDGRELLIATSAGHYAECIVRLIEDRTLYTKLSVNSRKFIENNYNNDELGKGLLDFYSKHIK